MKYKTQSESKRMMKAINSKSDFSKKTSSKHSSVKGGLNPKYNAFDISKESVAKPKRKRKVKKNEKI